MDWSKLIEDGPKNNLVRYLVYYPAMVVAGLFILFIGSNLAAEIISVLLVASCFVWVIILPFDLIHRHKTGRSFWD